MQTLFITPEDTLATVLKNSTHDLHARVESLLGSRLFSSQLTPEQYSSIISALYRIHRRVENRLHDFPFTRRLLQGRSKLAWLESDQKILERMQARSEHSEATLSLECQAEALGAMYVIEGSTLGGKIISQRLRQQPWLKNGRGLDYFRSYGVRRGEMWRRFVAELQYYDTHHADERSSIVSGALKTFELFLNEFTRVIGNAKQ